MPLDFQSPHTDRRMGQMLNPGKTVPGIQPRNYLLELLQYGPAQVQMERAIDFSQPQPNFANPRPAL